MSTSKQRNICFSVTRIIIFLLIVVSILSESPISDVCAIISAAMWLWLPQLIGWELKIIDKWNKE